MRKPIYTALFLLTFSIVAVSAVPIHKKAKDKLTTREFIDTHLKSIGTGERLGRLGSIKAIGRSKLVIKGRGEGLTDGVAILASTGEKNMTGMKFNNTDHQFEKFGWDGEKFTVGFTVPGRRSSFGSFLRVNSKTFKRGLLGGTLSTAWELHNYNPKEGKLKCKDTSKKNGIKLYKCNYNPAKGSDLSITMYFDIETFRHVRTEYYRTISAGLGSSVDNSARQGVTRYKLVEEFENFLAVDGLTLPHTYKILLEHETENGSTKSRYEINLETFIFNESIEDNQFRFG